MSIPQPSESSANAVPVDLPADSPTDEPPVGSRLELVQRLQQQLAGGQPQRLTADSWVSSGCPALDHLLPSRRGFRRGSLVEWFATEPGNGAGTLALLVARHACSDGGTLVVLGVAGQFYPPAAAASGIDLQRLVVIRPESAADALWAMDQALRSSAVKAVWGWLEVINDRWFRRFQLAAEQSGCLGLLLRSAKHRGDPSWSEVQLQVSTNRHRLLQVELVRCRGSAQRSPPPMTASSRSTSGKTPYQDGVVKLTLQERHGSLHAVEASEHETPTLHLVSELADPTLPGCSTGT